MNKKQFFKSCLDGYVQSFVLDCLLWLYASDFVLSADWFGLVWLLSPILPAAVYCSIMKKENKKSSIVMMSAISGISFITFRILRIIVGNAFGSVFNKILPIREVESSEAISYLFMISVFVILSIILKLFILIILLVKKRKKHTGGCKDAFTDNKTRYNKDVG